LILALHLSLKLSCLYRSSGEINIAGQGLTVGNQLVAGGWVDHKDARPLWGKYIYNSRRKSSPAMIYAQFSQKLRDEADMMQRHYAVFYCLENSIRELIIDRLAELYGQTWRDDHVPQAVRENCKKNRDKEVGAGEGMVTIADQ
jgi:hypothetical protein